MQSDLTSGAHYERTGRLYVWRLSRSKCTRRHGLDLCAAPSPLTPAQARLTVGRARRGHGASLAAGRQKHRSPPWLALGCSLVCLLGGVDAGEASQRTRDGSVRGGECGGTGVPWPPRRPPPADSGSFQYRPSLHGLGPGRDRGGQCVDPPCGPQPRLCRCQSPLVRYYGPGVAHRVSQRTWDLAGVGAALWPRPDETQNPRGGGGRCGTHTGADDPQDGQRTPSVCQEQTGQAPGVDALAHRGGAVDRADTSAGPGARRASRPCDATRPDHTDDHARGGQGPHSTDRAVDHNRGGSQGQNPPCGCDASAGAGAAQGGKRGGVWLAVSPESPRRGVSLWNHDPQRGGRVEDAFAGPGGGPRDLWGACHAHVSGIRSGWLCQSNAECLGARGCQADWYPAQRPRSVARCRGRPRDGQKRARQDRRHHWDPEERQIWVQQAQGTSVADAGDGRSPVYSLLQSEQVHAGSETGRQVRRKDIGSERTIKATPIERQEGSQEAPHDPRRSFATRSNYTQA